MNSGMMAVLISVRRHSMVAITMKTVTACARSVIRLTMVLLMAVCAPITSLFRRLTISPTLVWVKKLNGMRWNFSNRAQRKSKITPSPTLAFRRRSTTWMMPLAAGSASSARAINTNWWISFEGMVLSIRLRRISGESSDSPVVARIRNNIAASFQR